MLREPDPADAPRRRPSVAGLACRPWLPLLLGLFVISGLCALVYEVVWFQLLESVIGSTAVSLGVLLATFMGGMGLGSLALARFVSPRHHPLRVYAALELGIGVFAVLTLLVMPLVGRPSGALLGSALGAVLLRSAVCAVFLLPPTMMMGATLPAVSRWVDTTPRGVSWMGLLYGANTVGAVLGGVLAGFYLLRAHDTAVATGLAAALNVAIAVVALLAARSAPGARLLPIHEAAAHAAPGAWAVYLAIALSGASALGAEVLWTRLLSLMLGGTVYTFAMILAVFLTGLGLGSVAGGWLARRARAPRLVFAWCQSLQIVGVAWAALMVARILPWWPVDPSLSGSPWFSMHLDLTRVMWMVLPAAVLWGASFPLAIAAAARRDADPGRLVGRVYAANTIGAIVGSLAFSLLLIPWLGTRAAHQTLMLLCAVAAAALFLTWSGMTRLVTNGSRPRIPRMGLRTRGFVLASPLAAVILALLLAARVPEVPGLLVAYGRNTASWAHQIDVLYVGEGLNTSIAITRRRHDGATQLHVGGAVEATSLPQDMRLQRMLGHLPALVHGRPRSALVVGFGAGMTAGSLVQHPALHRLVICETEPLIPRVTREYFAAENHGVLRDSRVQLVDADARSHLLTTGETFDVITAEPVHPWVKGAAAQLTKEYFEALRSHLNPGGVVSQWVPLSQNTVDAVKSEIATFIEVFPNATLWANATGGRGYDLVLVGTLDSTQVDVEGLDARLAQPEYRRVAESLRTVGFYSLFDVLATYAGHAGDFRKWLSEAEVNHDRGLRLQYIAGMGANRYQGERIYDEILALRSFPDALFPASEATRQLLRNLWLGW